MNLRLCLILALCLSHRVSAETVFRQTSDDIPTMDPARAADVASSRAVALVYEGLLQCSYEARPYRLIPALAAEMPSVSRDGLRYTFRIREHAAFADDSCFAETQGKGRAVTAHDVVFSIKRVADAKTRSTGYWLFRGYIDGLDAFRELSTPPHTPTDYTLPVPGLRVLDERTVEITLTRPYPQFLWVLAMPYAFIVPHEAVSFYGADFASHPVGTGPYVLDKWRRKYKIEFSRNPRWQRDGRSLPSGRQPAIDRIQWFMISDPATRWLSFLAGQTDLYDRISRDAWAFTVADDGRLDPHLAKRGIVLSAKAGLQVSYCAFNMEDPVVGGNKALRQAMSYAFNATVWQRFYDGRITPARGPIPPGLAGYRPDPPRYAYNLDSARALMKEAGYAGGIDPATGRRLRLTLELGRTDQQTRESSELLAGFMREIGIVLDLSYNSWPAFLEKLSRRQAQMFRISWVGDYPDAQNFLMLFHSDNVSPGCNRANYANPAFDALFDKASVMQDSTERTTRYEALEAMVVEDAPWIFLGHPVDYTLHHAERVPNYIPHDFPYGVEKYYETGKERQ